MIETDGRPRILIIDDEEVVLDACAQILGTQEFDLAVARDGTTGLDRVGEFHPDLVFVDLKMPGISGFEVLEGIRARDPSIVTIVITGYATLSSAVEAMQKGAYDFLPKPFTPEEFRLVTRRGLERRRLAREAARLRAERDLLREQFASIVSHELKAPLAAVQQQLMLLAHELAGVLSEAQQERLRRLQGRIADLLALIATWLRAISSDLESLRASFRPVPIPTVVEKAVDSMRVLAERKDITLETDVPTAVPPVLGDEGTLVEALVNLVGNAIKYSPAGSRVIVSAGAREGTVSLAVRDFGVGIPPEDLPRILGGLSRAVGTAGETGAGLGLVITRRIVEVHGGTLTVASTPGTGTTVTISLPAAGPSAAEAVGGAERQKEVGVR
ncbi:MAG: response regulator [Armatimonadota bacterium]|nr:response regulator [Armatimonadota bacterium]MDR7450494.1 response regulator [Armatimonadota bacterium]MDR7466372.1 response regulator [Armatimonadota bacterium]MDR7493094.1 response regulator [Armatimonadota bacterium]MDR7498149.1 response regulator [Armatimonadota bacterium]